MAVGRKINGIPHFHCNQCHKLQNCASAFKKIMLQLKGFNFFTFFFKVTILPPISEFPFSSKGTFCSYLLQTQQKMAEFQ